MFETHTGFLTDGLYSHVQGGRRRRQDSMKTEAVQEEKDMGKRQQGG